MEAVRYPSGFDYLRLFLALSIFTFHSYSTLAVPWVWLYLFNPPWRGVFTMLLPMFFALSGFLVTGSLLRCRTLREFIALRILRIFPALLVEVMISAILLGSLLTTLPLQQYFMASGFWAYFRNIIGDIHFWLPGVFVTNPDTTMNTPLWTIPFELESYLTLIILSLLRLVSRRHWLLLAAVIGNIGLYEYERFYGVVYFEGSMPPRLLVMSFVYGMVIHAYRAWLPFHNALTLLALLISYYLLSSHDMSYFAPLVIAYATVGIGLLNPPRSKLLLSGDYSYGIYLYGWPIEQTYVYLFPESMRIWYLNMLFSLPITILLAVFSWHCIEKHVLKLKRYLKNNILFRPLVWKKL